MNIIENAIKQGRTTLSEYESKQILSSYQIPVSRDILVHDAKDLFSACKEIGYPVVLKGCSSDISHKTEGGLLRIDIRNDEESENTFNDIMYKMDGLERAVLVQEMVEGKRELVVGLIRDAQFGPCVMFGLGGIFTEILKDTVFRIAPLERQDAQEMMHEIKGKGILESVRVLPPADLDSLADILIAVGRIGIENDTVKEIDINPIIISGTKPVAVDALVILETASL